MKKTMWWQKALLASIVLLILNAVVSLALYNYRTKNIPVSPREQSILDEKLGNLSGTWFGIGLVVIWYVAYSKKPKQ